MWIRKPKRAFPSSPREAPPGLSLLKVWTCGCDRDYSTRSLSLFWQPLRNQGMGSQQRWRWCQCLVLTNLPGVGGISQCRPLPGHLGVMWQ